jgi:hypothetical protein
MMSKEKYQEALDELECYSIQWVVNYVDNEAADKMLNHSKLLQQLIDEKLEQESRKDKLIVGSEWECVLDLICPCLKYNGETKVGYELLYKTRVVTIVEVVNNYVKFKMDDYLCIIGLPQFLFCCRTRKETK